MPLEKVSDAVSAGVRYSVNALPLKFKITVKRYHNAECKQSNNAFTKSASKYKIKYKMAGNYNTTETYKKLTLKHQCG